MTFLERLSTKSFYWILLKIANTGQFKKKDSMDSSKAKRNFW
jgi:hypothetical protein